MFSAMFAIWLARAWTGPLRARWRAGCVGGLLGTRPWMRFARGDRGGCTQFAQEGEPQLRRARQGSMRQALACVLAAATYDALVGHACAGKITTSRPFLIDSTVADMQWVNSSLKDAKPNAKTVFVRSTLGSIHRSKDDGRNWVSQRDKFGNEDDEPYKTRIQQMIFSKADARYAIFKGYSENIWYTKDQGDTYQNHAFGVMMDIKTHSKQPEWLLASKFEGSFPDRYLSLFLSVDFGASWKKLVTHVYQFEWVRTLPLCCVRMGQDPPSLLRLNGSGPSLSVAFEWVRTLPLCCV